MIITILYFSHVYNTYFHFNLCKFGIWLETEKWWSRGYEHKIGIRFGNNVFEKRWQ